MSLPVYELHKCSDVEWLVEMPSHWSVVRLRALFEEVIEEGNADLPILSVSIHDGVSDEELGPDEMDRKVARSDDKAKYKKVLPDDLVYNMMRAWQGGFGTVRVKGMVSPAYVVARPIREDFETLYIENLLRTPAAIEEMRRHSHGVTDFRLRLYWDEFKNIKVPFPPAKEQGAILAFVGRETAKIDALVEEQQRLIALLKEKRQAVISQAVTKGLDPNAPMKDSGVEWLGKVPAHWEVLPIHRLIQTHRRITYGIVQPGEPDDNGRFMVRGQDYSFGWAQPETLFRVSDEIELPYKRARLMGGDIVMTIVGAGVGNVALVPDWLEGANLTQTTARLAIDTARADPRFVTAVLQGPVGRRSVERFAKGAAQPGLNLEHVRTFVLTVPPVVEQRAIANHVARETARLGSLSVAAESAIALLQERRSALISAAVTGKIDVRGLAPSQAEAA